MPINSKLDKINCTVFTQWKSINGGNNDSEPHYSTWAILTVTVLKENKLQSTDSTILFM